MTAGRVRGNWEERLEALGARHLPDRRLGVWEVAVETTAEGRTRLTGRTSLPAALAALRAEAGAEADVLLELLPDATASNGLHAVAHRSLAHLRSEPRHGAELVTQLVLGEEALVLRAQGPWLQVRGADGYVGWVHAGSVVRTAPDDVGAFRERLGTRRPPEGAWVVTARSPVARAAPDPRAPAAADLVRGAIVEAGEERDGALEVRLPDGTRGWIDAGAALPAARLAEAFPPTGRAVLAHAAEYLGLPYLWGGTSEKGFDCSGLVQRLYGLHGVPLPRDSDQQAAVGMAIDPGGDWSGVADGDLAFFAETPGGRATHVGFLTAGGRLLHASTSRNGVAWDALQPRAPEWSDYGRRLAGWLSGVRRVLAG